MLRRHVINLRQGRFSGGGAMRTRSSDVDAIFREHLPRALDEARGRGAPLRVLFYAHGGLVAEEAGLAMARTLVPWWLAHGVYPVYFVWETGLGETITQLLRGQRELAPTRGISDVSDRAIEEVARRLGGGKVWDGMRYWGGGGGNPGEAPPMARGMRFQRTTPARPDLSGLGR
jgi:hypothetical protein